MDWSSYKFHPSSLGKIMTNDRSGTKMGDTCKQHLVECWIKETYKREKDISNKYIEKGLAVEEDSITLYSRVFKQFYKKNTTVIENDFFIGEPDLFEGEAIQKADVIHDIKSSWDIYTFFAVQTKPVDKNYEWQLLGYMDLTHARKSYLAYCLVDTPDPLINDEKRKLLWKMGVATELDPLYLEASEKLESSMRFGDIPMDKRVIRFNIPYSKDKIEQAKERVIECREFLAAL